MGRLKVYSGSSWVNVDAHTSLANVSGLQSALDSKVNTNDLGSNGGVATLDSFGKVPYSQIPDELFSGMRFISTIDSTLSVTSITDAVLSDTDVNLGNYYIVNTDFTLTLSDTTRLKVEGTELSSGTHDLQAGDWLVIIKVEETPDYVTYALVDNNQTDKYMAKTGGTFVGAIDMGGNNVNGIGELRFNTSYRIIKDGSNNLIYYDAGTNRIVYHSGNLTYSTLNAAHVDHNHDSDYSAINHLHGGVYEPANVNIQGHISSTLNPHGVTAAQINALASTHAASGVTTTKIGHWDTAYTERGSNVAGTGLSWNDGSLHVSSVFDSSGTYATLRAQGTTASDVGLGNVTNESKATMFASPTFTGTVQSVTPSNASDGTIVATTAFVKTVANKISRGTSAHANPRTGDIWVDTTS